MIKKLSLLIFLTFNLYGLDDNNTTQNHTFINDLLTKVENTVDSNITDKLKLENVKEYIKSIKFNDKVDKSKYKLNLMGHYENYMLFGGYTPTRLVEKHWNTTDGTPDPSRDYLRDTNEAQFQLSIKTPLYSNFLNTKADLFAAYTQNSYWQVYDTDHSSPFRETNYMPELFLEWQPNTILGDSIVKQIRFALIHQSNGQDIGQSRSWNRTEIFFHLLNKQNHIDYGIHLWDRWDEDPKISPDATQGDDNPGLEKYLGKEKLFIKYKSEKFNIMLTHQNDLLHYDINYGNSKVDITFPSINSNFDFFIRYFNGYGESLIDYDIKIERISFGIMIADWI